MSEVRRYTMQVAVLSTDGCHYVDCVEESDGDWVDYADHARIVEEKNREFYAAEQRWAREYERLRAERDQYKQAFDMQSDAYKQAAKIKNRLHSEIVEELRAERDEARRLRDTDLKERFDDLLELRKRHRKLREAAKEWETARQNDIRVDTDGSIEDLSRYCKAEVDLAEALEADDLAAAVEDGDD